MLLLDGSDFCQKSYPLFKLLMAQLIALSFLVVFLWVRPYRRTTHNGFQVISLVTPVVGMGYAMAGLAEGGENSSADAASHDSTALVVIHVLLLFIPVITAIFTVVVTVYTWQLSRQLHMQEPRVKPASRASAERVAAGPRSNEAKRRENDDEGAQAVSEGD